jgi:hypothetical protein
LVSADSPGMACRICVFCWSSGWRKSRAVTRLRVEEGGAVVEAVESAATAGERATGRRNAFVLGLAPPRRGAAVVERTAARASIVSCSPRSGIDGRWRGEKKQKTPEKKQKNGHVISETTKLPATASEPREYANGQKHARYINELTRDDQLTSCLFLYLLSASSHHALHCAI